MANPKDFETEISRLEQEVADRAKLARGETVATVGGKSTPVETEPYDPHGLTSAEPLPPPRSPLLEAAIGPGEDTQVEIPPAARDPFQVEIERLERVAQEKARGPEPGEEPAFLGLGGPGRFWTRASSSFNAVIADFVGSTAEETGKDLAALGVQIFEKGADPKKAVHDWLNKQGVATRRYGGLAGRIGAATPEALVMTAAWMTIAPKMAAMKGPGILKSMGEAVQRNPGLVLAQELGGTMGARFGEEQGGVPGAILGAVLGGGAAQGARALLRPVARVTGLEEGAVRRAITGKDTRGFPPAGSAPIREPVDPQTATIVARQDIAASQRLLEARMTRTLDTAANASLRDPAMAAAQFHRSATEALEAARGIEKNLWEATAGAKAATTNAQPILDVFEAMRAETGPGKLGVLPNSFMRYFERKFLTPAKPAQPTGILGPTGQPIILPAQPAVPKDISVGDLLDFHSSILKRIARERKAPARGREINRELISNYVRLDEAMLDLVQRTVPGDRTIEAARMFSRFLNDNFTRGPMGAILGHAGRNEAVTPPGLAVQRLLRDYEGTRQIANISTVGNVGKVPQFSAAAAEAEQGIRSQFREAVEQAATPEQIGRYMQKIEPSVRPLARLQTELTKATDDLLQAHALKATIEKSALSRFVDADSAVAVRRLLADPNSPREARAIMREISHDPRAVAGLKAGVVDEIMRTSEGSPSTILKIMREPKMDRTLNEIFTAQERARFDRLVQLGARVEAGDEKLLRRFARGGVPILARIIGAQMGRTIARFAGGGTVQTPGIVAGVTKNWFADAFRGITVPELMARAVLDPKWEKALLTRIPENPRDIRKAIKWVLKPLINAETSTMAVLSARLAEKGRTAEDEGTLSYPGETEK